MTYGPEDAGRTPISPAGRGRPWPLIVAAAGLLVAGAAGIAVYLVAGRAGGDEATIRRLTENFAVAVAREDQARIIGLLCAEEARGVVQDDDYDPDNHRVVSGRGTVSIRISDIQVAGDVASARVTHRSRSVSTLHFRREAGGWKVCAPAGER
ncbi:hypothetical protein [Sphaerisporangium dianthi]|uniref:Nuclear transport factor 2 family protein n=1 Tax=Sphaerisporangium dianthi TaxID=1436120 RepID=A0ABV9CSU0_9ACTN